MVGKTLKKKKNLLREAKRVQSLRHSTATEGGGIGDQLLLARKFEKANNNGGEKIL